MRRVIPLDVRKQWARATSKRLKHSRAHRDLLAHLAFRAGSGRVWAYTLEELALGCDGSKPHVQRGLSLFANQGIITIKRNGPKASEYTVNFEATDTKEVSPKSYQNDTEELSSRYQRVIKTATNVLTKETIKKTLKKTDVDFGNTLQEKQKKEDVNFINAPQAKGGCDPLLETPETPPPTSPKPIPKTTPYEEPWWAGAFDSNGVIQVKDIPRSKFKYKPEGNCDRCKKQLQERDQRPPTCKDCHAGISPYMIKFNAKNREVYQ